MAGTYLVLINVISLVFFLACTKQLLKSKLLASLTGQVAAYHLLLMPGRLTEPSLLWAYLVSPLARNHSLFAKVKVAYINTLPELVQQRHK